MSENHSNEVINKEVEEVTHQEEHIAEEGHAEEGHHEHEITLAAEPLLEVGPLTISNSLFSAWIVVLFLVIVSLFIRKSLKKVPKGLQNIVEIILEGALDLADSVTNDRKKTNVLFPIAFTFFIFILFNNWLGLLPGVGTVGFLEHGTFIPFFRGGTADLNTTLALALVGVIFTHVAAIISIGAWKHLNKFVGIKLMMEIPKKMFKDPTIIIVNPIKAFVGVIEIVGEIAKIASLDFSLFGNIFAGEVLLVSMAAIFAYVIPIPFMFLEIIVGIIQALIFGMLVLVFGTIAMSDDH